MVTEKNIEDLRASLRILKINLEVFESGEKDVYRTISGELRKLLVDTKEPLVLRVYKEFRLQKLHFTEVFENHPNLLQGLVHFLPGRLFEEKKGILLFQLLFSQKQETMNLKDWLNQLIFKEGITIKELIKSVADKEGVHADPDYNHTLAYARAWNFNSTFCHVLAIYGIGRYLYQFTQSEKLEFRN